MGFFGLFGILLLIIVYLLISSIFFPTPFTDTGTVRYRTIPWMTFALIIVNTLVYAIWQALALREAGLCDLESGVGCAPYSEYIAKIYTYGFRETYLRDGVSIGAFVTFTAMFMHSSPEHLMGNMIYLWAFGRRVEDACGPGRYLLYYLLAGLVAHIGTAVLNNSGPDLPGVGASGAISGLMGAYLVLFPGARLTSFWVLGSVFRVPVVVFLKVFGQVSTVARWIIGGLVGAGIGYVGGGAFIALATAEIFGETGFQAALENVMLVQLAGVALGAVVFAYLLGQNVEKDSPIWRWTVPVPAVVMLVFYLARNLVPSINVIQGTQELSGVNTLAHLTGFLAALAIFFYVRKDLFTRYFSGRTV